jgi:hypothetical protein
MRKIALFVGLLALSHMPAAQAYIGPGLAAGTLAVVFGILSSIFLAFVGILWYPLKRLLRLLGFGKKPAAAAVANKQDASDTTGTQH